MDLKVFEQYWNNGKTEIETDNKILLDATATIGFYINDKSLLKQISDNFVFQPLNKDSSTYKKASYYMQIIESENWKLQDKTFKQVNIPRHILKTLGGLSKDADQIRLDIKKLGYSIEINANILKIAYNNNGVEIKHSLSMVGFANKEFKVYLNSFRFKDIVKLFLSLNKEDSLMIFVADDDLTIYRITEDLFIISDSGHKYEED